MKRHLVFTTLIYIVFLALTGSAGAEMTRVKEYSIPARVTSIELSSFRGSIQWIPVANREESRIIVEVVADGVSQMAVRNILLQVRIVDNIHPSSILLEARRPALPTGVNYVEVNYFVHAPPGQFRQFKAKTNHKPIEIVSQFNGELTLINNNAPIILHSGRGLVNLQTNQAPIELGQLDLAYSSQVQTSNGAISGIVSFPAQGTFSFSTTNAPIDLRMPLDTLGTFNLSASPGAIDFRLGKDIYHATNQATVERGEKPVFTITTSNSSITINAMFED